MLDKYNVFLPFEMFVWGSVKTPLRDELIRHLVFEPPKSKKQYLPSSTCHLAKTETKMISPLGGDKVIWWKAPSDFHTSPFAYCRRI